MSQSAALFGGPQKPQNKHLLQFRAGKMTINSDNWVHADPRKGWVYVYQSGDGKLHLCWIDRKTCLVEDNFVIGAQQAEFKRVPQCTTGRVYLLSFKNSKRFFVWMQEPNGKNDSNICSRINAFITSPPTQFTPPTSDWLTGFGGFNQFSQSDLLALLCKHSLFLSHPFTAMGAGLGSGLSSESDVNRAAFSYLVNVANAKTYQLLLRCKHYAVIQQVACTLKEKLLVDTPPTLHFRMPVNVPKAEKSSYVIFEMFSLPFLCPPKVGVFCGLQASEPPIDLNDAVNLESLRNLLAKPEIQARLLPHLPTNDDLEANPTSDLANLTTNIRSSQFKSTLKSFSAAFQTGELAPVLAQFKLGAEADEAAKHGDLVAFAQALQNATGSSTDVSSAEASPGEPSVAPPESDGQNKKEEQGGSSTDPKTNESNETAMDTD
ncbi:26S proteasome regulatory subunit N13 [Paragonimus westermani]|uniref:26S proteasome regulatory subunit N13 n=1 Tax=Paragonimus westermani TaxID=34504 RepID=A0A5J4NPG8_9TREM|nr:26S proteasome regulatory subunit N13 [Paragonimus westermani]